MTGLMQWLREHMPGYVPLPPEPDLPQVERDAAFLAAQREMLQLQRRVDQLRREVRYREEARRP